MRVATYRGTTVFVADPSFRKGGSRGSPYITLRQFQSQWSRSRPAKNKNPHPLQTRTLKNEDKNSVLHEFLSFKKANRLSLGRGWLRCHIHQLKTIGKGLVTIFFFFFLLKFNFIHHFGYK